MALQAPINYGIDVPDAGKAFEEGMLWRQQYNQQQAARAEGEEIKKAIATLGPNPTVQSINALIIKYPALAERFKKPLEILSEQERQTKQSQAIPIYGAMMSGNMDTAISLLQQQADAARNAGNAAAAKALEDQIKFIQADPAAARTAYGVTMAALMGPDKFQETYNTMQNNLRENELQPDKIAELKAKAIKAAATGGFETHSATTLTNGVTILVGKDGTRQVRDVNGNIIDGTNAALAISQAQDYGVNLEIRKAGGAAAARGAAEAAAAPAIAGGTESGKTGVQMATDAFKTATKVSANMANLNRARELAASGVNTGVIASRLPNWSAGAVELANLRNQLGLDVIGTASFGALSEGELNLALNTALPTNLNQDELVNWLDRKIAAQEKVRMEYLKVARFLSKPGNTLDKWLEQNGITPEPAPAAAPPAAVAPGAVPGGGWGKAKVIG